MVLFPARPEILKLPDDLTDLFRNRDVMTLC